MRNYHKKINYAFILFSRLRCDMLQWKRLLGLEDFENERLPKIVSTTYGKM